MPTYEVTRLRLNAVHVSPARSTRSADDDYSYSSDLVRETRRRLAGLEREAHDLQENYRNFQCRISSVGSDVINDAITAQLGTPRRPVADLHDELGLSPTVAGSAKRCASLLFEH